MTPTRPRIALHPASLLPITMHNRQLVEQIRRPVPVDFITYIADACARVIKIDDDYPTPPTTPNPSKWWETQRQDSIPPLTDFIKGLMVQSNVQMPTLAVILVYLDRLREKLPRAANGLKDTRHRVFLATLICAAKYLNDSSPKNMHWQKYAKYFSLSEVNLMEKQMLFLLDYSLGINEQDVFDQISPYWASAKSGPIVDFKPVIPERKRSLEEPVAPPSKRFSPEPTSTLSTFAVKINHWRSSRTSSSSSYLAPRLSRSGSESSAMSASPDTPSPRVSIAVYENSCKSFDSSPDVIHLGKKLAAADMRPHEPTILVA